MAKQGKVLLARRQRERAEGSVLLQSAESLGRVIGSLQRQLDSATKRFARYSNDGSDAEVERRRGKVTAPRSRDGAVNGNSGRSASAATKKSSTAKRKAKTARSTTAKASASSGGSRKKSTPRRSSRR